jgi:DnaJ-like protein
VTAKKPLGESWESWVETQIRDAMERGEFANLPGAGKPIPDIDEPHDDLWWIRQKLRRENVSYLPPTLEIRRKIEDALDRVARAQSERDVRDVVAAINERIVRINSRATEGPPSSVVPLDVETILLTWRAGRGR